MRAAFGLFSLLIIVLLVAWLGTKELSSLSKNGNPKAPINAALSTKQATDLATLETRLNVYFTDNGIYPADINDIDTAGLDVGTTQYQRCSENKVLISSQGGKSVILDSGAVSSGSSC